MRPSSASFVTLFVLITTIFAAPLNLTSGIDGETGISTSSEDSPMPLQRRDPIQTSVYWAVQNLERVHKKKIEENLVYVLPEPFRGSRATVEKFTTRDLLEDRTIDMMLRNLITVDQLIKYAEVECAAPGSSDYCWSYYVVTKEMGVSAKSLKTEISPESLPGLREKARDDYQKKFKLIYSDDDFEDDYVYRFIKGTKELEAKIVGIDWAFAKPVGHADPGKPEIFKQ